MIGKGKSANSSDHNMASPYDHFRPVGKSGLDHWSSALSGGRTEMETPHSHYKPVKKSGGDGIGDPPGMKGKRNSADHMGATPHSHFAPVPHSMPEAPEEIKSWKKKGYYKSPIEDSSLTMAAGAAINKKWRKGR